ncbi:hypothetical protein [Botrimarina mediterranea]|uniref:hypothetical protein n=1 Tax=Botrimarina mediterranea TaxID=2528022 RepID=UPI00118A93A1|nr:hypothetical protein K2D_16970 [Planctomycetes bacterium K2D]
MYVTLGNVNLSTLGGLTGTSHFASYEHSRQETPNGFPDTYTVNVTVAGMICLAQGTAYTTDEAQTALSTAIAALEAATAVQGQSVVLMKDNGAQSVHGLNTALAIGGVSYSPPSYPGDDPTEYVTGRRWQFTASAIFNDFGAGQILDHRETVEISGGWPQKVRTVVSNGPAIETIVAASTVGMLVQSGTIVGRDQHFPLPPQLYPSLYDPQESSASVATPLMRNGVPYAYSRNYRYVHYKLTGPFDLPELGSKL